MALFVIQIADGEGCMNLIEAGESVEEVISRSTVVHNRTVLGVFPAEAFLEEQYDGRAVLTTWF